MNRCCHSPLPLITKPLKVKMCSKKGSQQVRIFNSVATPFSKKHIAGHSPQFEKDKLSQGESNCDDDRSGPLFSMYVKMAVEEDRIMADSLKADADRVLIFVGAHVFSTLHGLIPEIVVWSVLCSCCSAPYGIDSGPSTRSAGKAYILSGEHLSTPRRLQQHSCPHHSHSV